MDLLKELQEIKDDLDDVVTDRLPHTQARKLNRAKNKLAAVVFDGERRAAQKHVKVNNPDATSPSPHVGEARVHGV